MQIKVRYIDKELTPLEKIEKGDLIDLRVSKIYVNGIQKAFPCEYAPNDVVFVKFGVAMKLPKGYKANVFPRSSTFKNYGLILTNSVGQIDNSYNGNNDEWCAMFAALKHGVINYNDRICQFDIAQVLMNGVKFEIVEDLGTLANRGGYGSTGTK